MLIPDYYTILQHTRQRYVDIFHISLNSDCEVYKGHFPNEPVSPGVCNIQMIKECLECILGYPVLLHTIQQCRLTALITPVTSPQLDVRIQIKQQDNERIIFTATLGPTEHTYLELKAEAVKE